VQFLVFQKSLPITEPDSFIEFETGISQPAGRDILLKINAINVNPVDYKIRQNSDKEMLGELKIIGWDAAGIVKATGCQATLFKKGYAVYYAGDITRSGCNSEYQLVDIRAVSGFLLYP
jgi:NADPH2:quinone reductase